jgi:hypothetical protein
MDAGTVRHRVLRVLCQIDSRVLTLLCRDFALSVQNDYGVMD